MISIVNGFVCTSSCEAAKARQGKDPHTPPGAPPYSTPTDDKTSAFAGQPATVVDAFKDLASKDSASANPVIATTASAGALGASSNSRQRVDLLV
jgi:hypothetical protein